MSYEHRCATGRQPTVGPMNAPSCPLCGLKDRTGSLHWDSLYVRGAIVAARDAYRCERCDLVFESTDAEWNRGRLGEHTLADRRRGDIDGQLGWDERIAGLEYVARIRDSLGDFTGGDRCLAKITAIQEGRDPSQLDPVGGL